MFSVTFNPIGSWPVVAVASALVAGLTLWAYQGRIRATTGAWRWVALGLRLFAVILCLIAALRPSIVFQEKRKQPASILFLVDDSESMKITDEVGGQSRWDAARRTIALAREATGKLDDVAVKFYRFNTGLREDPERSESDPGPTGRETAIGAAMREAVRRETGTKVAQVFLLSDGSNNSGVAPLTVARQLQGQQVPIVTVGFGSETAGSNSRDLAIRDLIAGPTVFVKNQMQVRATLLARGFANQTLDLEMLVEGQDQPVATQRVKVPQGAEVIPVTGLKYVPQTPGEKKITLRVKPKEGELVPTNNEMSTFVRVLKGGLNALFVQGPHSPWEQKFFMRAVASSPDVQADLKVIRGRNAQGATDLSDEDFVSGKYDVYVLSDLPADFLTPTQQALLARSVERGGAGLIMLGGRSSFGAGGWGSTEVGRILPVSVRPSDGQIEPEGGVRFIPNRLGLENYLMQIGPNSSESARLWSLLPPLAGVNRFGPPKPNAIVLGQTPGTPGEPIMVGMEAGAGRTLAFAGETWTWPRSSDEGRTAHRKFWRQVIFWLAHKEDQGESEVKLTLDSRRIAVGQKLEVSVSAKDEKGVPLTGLTLDLKVEREETEGPKFSEPLDPFLRGDDWQSTFYATQSPPGSYRVTAVATRAGQEIGRDSARFMINQDDRELENPAADRALLRNLA
ncbi:MAG: glutamine amidotransferase, partial [Isosphaeraceae bacterium]